MNPYTIASSLLGGGINAIQANKENKAMRKMISQYNKNIERSAVKTEGLSASEGVNQQAAYQWASNMMRKHSGNQAALESAANVANSRMESSLNKQAQLRAAAIEMLSKKLEKPPRLTFLDHLGNFGSGAAAGASFGVEAFGK